MNGALVLAQIETGSAHFPLLHAATLTLVPSAQRHGQLVHSVASVHVDGFTDPASGNVVPASGSGVRDAQSSMRCRSLWQSDVRGMSGLPEQVNVATEKQSSAPWKSSPGSVHRLCASAIVSAQFGCAHESCASLPQKPSTVLATTAWVVVLSDEELCEEQPKAPIPARASEATPKKNDFVKRGSFLQPAP
jgi:hypothetical protein